jgi:hypothetical protein
MNTQQPAEADTPTAAPAGQQWTWCVLMDFYEIASCRAVLRMDPSANYTQARPQDIWDTYYRYATDATPPAGSWTIFYNTTHNATTPPPPPPINLQTATASYFHQPLVSCYNYTQIVSPTASPECCTLSAVACAARCDATPGCLAFKYPWRALTRACLHLSWRTALAHRRTGF